MGYVNGNRGNYFRHRIEYTLAKYRLEQLAKERFIDKLLNKHFESKKLSQKPQKTGKHVQFNLTPKVVDFVKTCPPTTTINRFPSLIENLSDDQLSAECYRLNLLYNSMDKQSARDKVVHEWIEDMRTKLSQDNIDVEKEDDKDIENIYNLWKSILRSTCIRESGSEIIPQLLSVYDLKKYLNQYNIIYKDEERSHLIRDLENTLIDESTRLDSPYCDYRKKHITGEDLFMHQYGFCTPSQLKQEIEKRHLNCPKTLAAKKKVLIQALNQELSSQFTTSFLNTIRDCLRYRKVYSESAEETKTSLLLDLYHYKQEHNEPIDIEYD